MEENFGIREKFINEAIEIIGQHDLELNDWEKNFMVDIKRIQKKGWSISNHQFNKLMEIKDKYK